jgi:hypothetical protein
MLAFPLPCSIEDPIIKCAYLIEVAFYFDSWLFSTSSSFVYIPIDIVVKDLYELKSMTDKNMNEVLNLKHHASITSPEIGPNYE